MISSSKKEWRDFLKKIEEGMKHPTGPVPTPKIKKALKQAIRDLKKKQDTKFWVQIIGLYFFLSLLVLLITFGFVYYAEMYGI